VHGHAEEEGLESDTVRGPPVHQSAAIDRLPFNYRAAVVLRFVTGLDYAAAAEAMDVPLNTFKSHLLRGTKLLRADLARHLEPPESRPAQVPGGIPVPTSSPRS
jgi:RNA polymerase sigma-70 factor (ECF subfamily)